MVGGICLGFLACNPAVFEGSSPVAEGGEGGESADRSGADETLGGAADATGLPHPANGGSAGSLSFSTGGTASFACEKDEQVCKGSVLYGCNITRTGLEPLVDCAKAAPNGFCDVEGENGPTCAHPVCESGAKRCEGTTLYSCDKHGQYVGTVDPKACPPAPDPAPVCEPDTWRCSNGSVQVCLEQGQWSAPAACESGWHCADLGGSGECITNACTAGTTVCLGNQVGSCATDEQSLSDVSLDCKTQGQVCTAEGACSGTAQDQMGPSPDSKGDVKDWVDLLILDVHTDRTLTELAMHLDLTSAGEVGFLVYEHKNGGYTLELDDATSVEAGDSVFTSHPLDFQLKAGHRYVLGVRVAAPGSYYLQVVYKSRKLSFANVVGAKGYDGDYQSLPDYLDPNDYESQLRITTAPPAP